MKTRQNCLSPTISEVTKLDLELIFRFFFDPKMYKTLTKCFCLLPLKFLYLSLIQTKLIQYLLLKTQVQHQLWNSVLFLDARSKFFIVRIITKWHNFPRDMVESSLLEIFKLQVDRVLDGLIYAPFPMEGWTRWSFKVPSNLGCCVVLQL